MWVKDKDKSGIIGNNLLSGFESSCIYDFLWYNFLLFFLDNWKPASGCMQIIQDYSQGDCQESLPPSCKRHGFFLLAVAVADRVLGRKAAPPPSNNHRIYQQQPRSVPQGYILPDIPGPTSSQMYQTQPLPWPRPDFPVETSSAGLNSSGQIMTVIWPSALLLLAGVTMVTLVDRQVLLV